MADSGTLKVTLYIVRHGECIGNKEQKALDPFIDFLTDAGKEQAKLLGETLQDVQFTRVFASDYPRTVETANTIMEHNKAPIKIAVTHEKQLRERDYTGVVGMDAAPLISMMMGVMRQGTPFLKVDLPGCEPSLEFEDRIITFVAGLLKNLRSSTEKEETLLFVSHGLTIQRILVLLNSRPNDFGVVNWTQNLFAEKLMRNTNCHRLVFDIPRDENVGISAYVDRAHFREHVTNADTTEYDSEKAEDIKDTKNYTFLENEEMRTHEEETTHYCKPV